MTQRTLIRAQKASSVRLEVPGGAQKVPKTLERTPIRHSEGPDRDPEAPQALKGHSYHQMDRVIDLYTFGWALSPQF